MKEMKVRIIVIIALLSITVFLYFLYTKSARRYQWFESYDVSSEQPYGTSFIQKMLQSYRSENHFIVNEEARLKDILKEIKDPGRTDYVLIGQNIYLDEESVSALAKFIHSGGNAFIASLAPPEQIIKAVYFEECGAPIEFIQNTADSVTLNFFHPHLRMKKGTSFAFRLGTQDFPYSWNYVSPAVFCDSSRSIAALGFQDEDRVNFIRVQAGQGNLYLHSNPLVFTNYFLTRDENVKYASSIFLHLDGHDLIWDEYSKIYFPERDHPYDSPLYYILQQPSLKYAWWLMLATVALYVLLASKRKQRVIPVSEMKSNTSLEFVNLISRLHYKNGSHLDMAHKKMKYFLYFVRSKYGIHVEKFTDEHIRRLAEKSKVKYQDVEVIFSRYYLIEEKFRNNIEANRLVDLYDAIENFYRQSK